MVLLLQSNGTRPLMQNAWPSDGGKRYNELLAVSLHCLINLQNINSEQSENCDLFRCSCCCTKITSSNWEVLFSSMKQRLPPTLPPFGANQCNLLQKNSRSTSSMASICKRWQRTLPWQIVFSFEQNHQRSEKGEGRQRLRATTPLKYRENFLRSQTAALSHQTNDKTGHISMDRGSPSICNATSPGFF